MWKACKKDGGGRIVGEEYVTRWKSRPPTFRGNLIQEGENTNPVSLKIVLNEKVERKIHRGKSSVRVPRFLPTIRPIKFSTSELFRGLEIEKWKGKWIESGRALNINFKAVALKA